MVSDNMPQPLCMTRALSLRAESDAETTSFRQLAWTQKSLPNGSWTVIGRAADIQWSHIYMTQTCSPTTGQWHQQEHC
eukprot:6070555-Amphidinium_carterae.1